MNTQEQHELERQLLEMLGLSGRAIRKITVRFTAGEPPTVETVEEVNVATATKFVRTINRFKLVPLDHP